MVGDVSSSMARAAKAAAAARLVGLLLLLLMVVVAAAAVLLLKLLLLLLNLMLLLKLQTLLCTRTTDGTITAAVGAGHRCVWLRRSTGSCRKNKTFKLRTSVSPHK
jgi:hypothetical protein